jgi:hypothetical protein
VKTTHFRQATQRRRTRQVSSDILFLFDYATDPYELIIEPKRDKVPGKANDTDDSVPQADVIATWNKGDEDLEPSTKMLALVRLLKSWSDTGDKCICYSQCSIIFFALLRRLWMS